MLPTYCKMIHSSRLNIASIHLPFVYTQDVAFYKRDCYQAIFILVNEMLDCLSPFYNVLLTGSQGIGKTTWLHWTINMILQKTGGPNVMILDFEEKNLYIRIDKKTGKIIHGNRMYSFREDLKERSTLYCYDGCISGPLHFKDMQAQQLVVTSPSFHPSRSLIRFQNQMSVLTIVMPLWSLQELQICKQELYADISSKQVEELFKLWGGLIRPILCVPYKQSIVQYNGFLQNIDFRPRLETNRATTSELDLSGTFQFNRMTMNEQTNAINKTKYNILPIIHIQSSPLFQFHAYAFCSDHACAIVCDRMNWNELAACTLALQYQANGQVLKQQIEQYMLYKFAGI